MAERTMSFRGNEVEFTEIYPAIDLVWNFVDKIKADDGAILGYRVISNIGYYSGKYKKFIVCEAGDRSDGATGAKDLDSFGWLFHDELCSECIFEDGTPCTNWQASNILSEIMRMEGFWFREKTWFWSTWFLGGKKIIRTNGWR